DLASRMHAAVLQDVEGKRFLVDLKSTHGTFLDSKRLKPHSPVEWPAGVDAHFGSGSKAEVVRLGRGRRKQDSASDQKGEIEAKRRRTAESQVDIVELDSTVVKSSGASEDLLAALYGDMPEAKVVSCEVKAVKLDPLPPPVEDPTKILFLDIDGVLRPLHSRQDAFTNVKTIQINGAL
ncbi:unnamed protein product, partial [Polarella glacialis]